MSEIAVVVEHDNAPENMSDNAIETMARTAIEAELENSMPINGPVTIHELTSSQGRELANALLERQQRARRDALHELKEAIANQQAAGAKFEADDDIRYQCFALGVRDSQYHDLFDMTSRSRGAPIIIEEHLYGLFTKDNENEDLTLSIARVPVSR